LVVKREVRVMGAHINHAKIANVCKVVVFLQLRGGKEVEADGKTVVLNSRETIKSVKFAVSLWKEAWDEGGLAWDDTNNNRAFLSGSISATNNGAAIYIEAKRKPESYQTGKGAPMWQDILHARIPKRAGRPIQPAVRPN
jgi:multiple sugar transport system substrate-binding protein